MLESGSERGARSLPFRLVALVLSVLVPAAILGAEFLRRATLLDRERSSSIVLNLARNVADDLDREIVGAIQTLQALASSPTLLAGDLPRFHLQARDVLQPRGLHALLRAPDGRQVVNTRVPYGTPLPTNELSREDRLVLTTRRPAVTDILVGSVARTWVLGVQVPVVIDQDVRYILIMSVDLGFMRRLIETSPRHEAHVVTIYDRTGRIAARTHDHEAHVGRVVDRAAMSPPPEGVSRVTMDGVETLRGYRWSTASGWLVAACVPVSAIEAPLRDLWTVFGLLAAALVAVALPLSYRLGQRIAAPIAAAAADARRLGEGHVVEPRRSSLREANDLSKALSRASHDLRERTRALAESEALFRAVFDQSAVGFEQIAMDGRLIGVNDRLCTLLGYTREECLEKTFKVLTHEDDWAAEDALLADLFDGRIPSYVVEKRLLPKTGDPIWVRVTSSLVRGPDGTPLQRTAAIEDVTEQRRAREVAARLAAIVQASQDAIVSVSQRAVIETWNPGATGLFGYTPEQAIGQSLEIIAAPALRYELLLNVQAALAGETVKVETVRRHQDGSEIDVACTDTPIRTNGTVTAVSVTIEDIRERKRRDTQIMLLNRELAHRVKNSLAVIQSIANQTLRSSPDPEEFRVAFQGRLQALASANDLLMQTSWDGATLADFVDSQLAPLMPRATRQIAKTGPHVKVPTDLAIPLGLALHELGTNAIKYGAWSVPDGNVAICWRIEPDADEGISRLVLSWRETGGPPVAPPTRRGFGTTVIERGIPNAVVTRTFDAGGVVCVIDITLPAGALREITPPRSATPT